MENISLLYRRHTSARQYLVLLLAGRHLSVEIFTALCEDMESFLFVCVLIKEEIRTFEALFARWSLLLSNVKTMEDYKAFSKETFQKRKYEHAAQFYLTFKEIDEKSLPKYQLRYVLAKLTQAVDKEAYGSVAPLSYYCNTKEVHMEHILPRSPSAEAASSFGPGADDSRLVWSIGNLALVEKSINTSLGNRDFDHKKKVYPKSRYLLTKVIAERPDIGKTAIDRAVAHMRPFEMWNRDAIRQRAAWLADLACVVWAVPVDRMERI